MVVDPRHDHSFRAPRPDLTVALGRENAPNACNDCHRDRSPQWAARAVRRWYPGGQQEKPHYAFALHAGRTFQPAAEPAPPRGDPQPEAPGIVRGTAVSLLPPTSGPTRSPRWRRRPPTPTRSCGWGRPRPSRRFPRRSACGSASTSCGTRCGRCGWRRSPRSPTCPTRELATEARAAFDRSLDDFFLAQRSNAERPESHVNLGIVEREAGTARGGAAALRDRAAPRAVVPSRLRQPRRSPPAAGPRRRGREASCAQRPAGGPEERLGRTTRWACSSCGRSARARPWPSSAARRRSTPGSRTSPTRTPSACTRRGGPTRPSPCCEAAQKRSPGSRGLLVALVTIHRERGSLREARAWAPQARGGGARRPVGAGPRRVARARGGGRAAVDWPGGRTPWRSTRPSAVPGRSRRRRPGRSRPSSRWSGAARSRWASS